MTEFIYKDIAVGAQEDASYSTVAHLQMGADASNLLNSGVSPYDYSSFELDSYDPDNPRPLMPSNAALGISSTAQSNNEGVFEEPITVTIEFIANGEAEYFIINGITLHTKIPITSGNITYYSGNTAISGASYDFSADSSDYYVRGQGINTDKIVLTVNAIANPYSFFDLYSVDFGQLRRFNSKNIHSAKLEMSVNVSGQQLPIDALKLSINNDENADYLFQQKQPIEEWTHGDLQGTYYIEKGVENNAEPTIELECYDLISNLDGDFYGGIYTLKPIGELVEEILSDTTVTCSMSADISAKTVSGYIPITTKRQALVYVACATGCIFLKNPVFSLVELPRETTQSFDIDKVFYTPKITATQEIKGVTLVLHNYSKGDEEIEVFRWYLPYTPDESGNLPQRTITFSQPLHSLKAYTVTESTEDGITSEILTPTSLVSFVEVGANYCVVTNTSNKKICIKGQVYVDSKDEITQKSEYINRHQPFKIKKIEDFTLMSDADSKNTAAELKQSILRRLYDYYTKGKKFSGEVFEEHQNVNIGDYTNVVGYNGIISKLTTEYNKVTKIEVE